MNPSRDRPSVEPFTDLLETTIRFDPASFRARIGSPDRAQRALHAGPKSLPGILASYKERESSEGRDGAEGYLEAVENVWRAPKKRPTPKVPLGFDPCDNCGRSIPEKWVKCSCGFRWYCSDACLVEGRASHIKDHPTGK